MPGNDAENVLTLGPVAMFEALRGPAADLPFAALFAAAYAASSRTLSGCGASASWPEARGRSRSMTVRPCSCETVGCQAPPEVEAAAGDGAEKRAATRAASGPATSRRREM